MTTPLSIAPIRLARRVAGQFCVAGLVVGAVALVGTGCRTTCKPKSVAVLSPAEAAAVDAAATAAFAPLPAVTPIAEGDAVAPVRDRLAGIPANDERIQPAIVGLDLPSQGESADAVAMAQKTDSTVDPNAGGYSRFDELRDNMGGSFRVGADSRGNKESVLSLGSHVNLADNVTLGIGVAGGVGNGSH